MMRSPWRMFSLLEAPCVEFVFRRLACILERVDRHVRVVVVGGRWILEQSNLM